MTSVSAFYLVNSSSFRLSSSDETSTYYLLPQTRKDTSNNVYACGLATCECTSSTKSSAFSIPIFRLVSRQPRVLQTLPRANRLAEESIVTRSGCAPPNCYSPCATLLYWCSRAHRKRCAGVEGLTADCRLGLLYPLGRLSCGYMRILSGNDTCVSRDIAFNSVAVYSQSSPIFRLLACLLASSSYMPGSHKTDAMTNAKHYVLTSFSVFATQ